MIIDPLPDHIIRYPDPRLRLRCDPIDVFDESVARLAERMLELMKRGSGVGLAGPQVGICRRIFVFNPTGELDDDQNFSERTVLGCRAEFSPQNHDGLKSRKDKCGEAACDKSSEDNNTKKTKEGGQIEELCRFELLAG